MFTFDSFTLVPRYSDIESRSQVDVSTTIKGKKSNLPIINANMHSVCTPKLTIKITEEFNTFSSYHRFFKEKQDLEDTFDHIFMALEEKDVDRVNNLFFPSVGVQKEDYELVEYLAQESFNNIIVDVNHGHHKMVKNMVEHIVKNYPDMLVMVGNVSSVDGVKFLRDAGAHVVKIGNSYGSSCTTRFATAVGVHAIHTAKAYREETGDWDTDLCIDGSIQTVGDIVKSLVWGNLVMIGKMFAACDESNSRVVMVNNQRFKEYYGNASVITKQITDSHVKYIEGTSRLIEPTGPVESLLTGIRDGLQSAFSFMGARNLDEFQLVAHKQVLKV